jgi:replicative DNA helicase
MNDVLVKHCEAMVVGGAAKAPVALAAIDLDPSDFCHPAARKLFEAMRERSQDGGWRGPHDLCSGAARHEHELQLLSDYLGEAMVDASPRDVPGYADQVREHSTTRRVLELAGSIAKIAESGTEGDDLVVEVQSRLMELRHQRSRLRSRTAADLALSLIELIEHPEERGTQLYVPTGLARIDRAIEGWQGGVVSMLGGRTSHGKSAVLLQCALHATSQGTPVHLLSAEDLETDTGWRIMSRLTGLPASQLRRYSHLDDKARERAGLARGKLEHLERLRITPAAGMTARQIVATVRLYARSDETGLVMYDYLQRLPPERGGRKRYETLSDAMNLFDDGAKETGIPWVIGSQLRRSDNEYPKLADFRDAGTIEEFAKMVIGIYRPGKDSGKRPDDTMWIGVLKASNDELIQGEFRWDGPMMTVSDNLPTWEDSWRG